MSEQEQMRKELDQWLALRRYALSLVSEPNSDRKAKARKPREVRPKMRQASTEEHLRFFAYAEDAVSRMRWTLYDLQCTVNSMIDKDGEPKKFDVSDRKDLIDDLKAYAIAIKANTAQIFKILGIEPKEIKK